MTDKTPAEPNDTTQAASASPEPNRNSLEEQLAAARQEAAANYDRYTRAVADMENFRRRTLRDKEDLRLFALSGFMEDALPILDSLGLGLVAARQQTDVKAIVDGLSLIIDQFKTTLGRHGLKEVDPAGQKFDPHFHECISHQPSADVGEEHVIQVVRLGYTLNGRLLRPASVIVSSGPAR